MGRSSPTFVSAEGAHKDHPVAKRPFFAGASWDGIGRPPPSKAPCAPFPPQVIEESAVRVPRGGRQTLSKYSQEGAEIISAAAEGCLRTHVRSEITQGNINLVT